MFHSHSTAGIFGKIAHLAVLGVGILFLGPVALGIAAVILGIVVSILGVALPFVVIGAIGYMPYVLVRRMLGSGPPRRVVLKARRELPPLPPRPVPVALAFEQPPPTPVRKVRGVVARVAREVLCGSLVGGILGAVAVIGTVGPAQVSTMLDYSALGMGIGAVVGFVVGGPRPAPTEKTPAVG